MKSATNFKNYLFRTTLIHLKRSSAARQFPCTKCIHLEAESAMAKNLFFLTQH